MFFYIWKYKLNGEGVIDWGLIFVKYIFDRKLIIVIYKNLNSKGKKYLFRYGVYLNIEFWKEEEEKKKG